MATQKKVAKKATKPVRKSTAKKAAKPVSKPTKAAAKKKPAAKKAGTASKSKPAPVKKTSSKKVPVKKVTTKKTAVSPKPKTQKAAPAKNTKAAPKKPVTAVKKTATSIPDKKMKKSAAPKEVVSKEKKAAVKKPAPEKKKETAGIDKNGKEFTEQKPVLRKPIGGKSKFIYKPEPSILDKPVEYTGPVKRYSDTDLKEFKEIILKKLDGARKELTYLQGLITRKDETGTDDTENKYMSIEDGSGTLEREQLNQMASRQIQFIDHLEKALMRIENKTYGICRVTGKLIDKARLRAVPHATLSIEAKQQMNK